MVGKFLLNKNVLRKVHNFPVCHDRHNGCLPKTGKSPIARPLEQLIQHLKPLCPFYYLANLTLDQTFPPNPSDCLDSTILRNNCWQNTKPFPPNPFIFTPLSDKNGLLTKFTEV